ncbi:hypothetical protein N4G70_08075 [Streptomyces sp. ASQP_92]|uniref:hypothetical protein n=1 Tax=unclassified Streptomyces TaxID=2593676 RepID=UPI0021C021DF|nr:hypothetical protein [Streptomyces sp. ASQP_92]MCT9088823.1 hypothetical protein [Streptomyces sp. ASQP_92]
MSSGVLIILIAVVVIVVVAVALGVLVARRGRGLRSRFGPEYERTVAQHNGDVKAAEKDLDERVRRYGDLKVEAPTAEDRRRYAAEWARIQEEFVDSPTRAVADAEALLGRLAQERGFPAGSSEEQLAALSVHHPHHLDSYRRIRGVAQGADGRRSSTEELRETLVQAHEFFAVLAGERRGDKAGRLGVRGGRHASHTDTQHSDIARGSQS